MTILEMGQAAKAASHTLATAGTMQKNEALAAMAKALKFHEPDILEANEQDIEAAQKAGVRDSLLDRLRLTPERIDGMAKGLLDVAMLPDPVGDLLEETTRPNGLRIRKLRVPLGVIGIIYEARPNVTSDAAGLCLKAGNATILRGGKEAIRSNNAIANALREGVAAAGLPADCVQLVTNASRDSAKAMMHLNEYLDVLIPRGGAGLIRAVVSEATVPVIETGVGNCHVFVDAAADVEMATNIILNAKTSRPSVCNAAETLLVHNAIAKTALPTIAATLKAAGVTLRGDEATRKLLNDDTAAATEEDWATEYGDYILAVKVVSSVDEAIEHIRRYGTGHSECIVTNDAEAADLFCNAIDAAAVYVNASTRFTDGGEFGLGAEIGISTQKLHARGPMGLCELTSMKYRIDGNGQIR